MRPYIILPMLAFVLFIRTAIAQDIPPGMKTYTFVMLTKGHNRTHDSATVATIQKEHLAHINSMGESGILNLAGPFLDNGNWRGILVFNTQDTGKVRSLVEADPAVKAGRLSYEIHPWLAEQGSTLK